MATADLLAELAGDIQNAYSSVNTKGGTVPQNKNTNNLATAIGTIPTGITPTGAISITQNGTVDVTNYASAAVNVPAPTLYVNRSGVMYQEITDITYNGSGQFQENSYQYCDYLKELYVHGFYATYGVNGSYAFQWCPLLEKVEFDVMNTLSTGAMRYCQNLRTVKLGKNSSTAAVYKIGANCFTGCTSFDTLILPGDSVCALDNVNAFGDSAAYYTPFRLTSGSGGTVYVPQALISSYESATNWSALEHCTFAAIEGSVYA